MFWRCDFVEIGLSFSFILSNLANVGHLEISVTDQYEIRNKTLKTSLSHLIRKTRVKPSLRNHVNLSTVIPYISSGCQQSIFLRIHRVFRKYNTPDDCNQLGAKHGDLLQRRKYEADPISSVRLLARELTRPQMPPNTSITTLKGSKMAITLCMTERGRGNYSC